MHHDVLACIEETAVPNDAAMDEVDARIAAELGVPLDYYFAYLVVWNAIEHYRATVLSQEPLPLREQPDPLVWAQALADEIGWTASGIYQQSSGAQADVNASAGRVIAAALQLRSCLRQVSSGKPVEDGQVAVAAHP
jgi:hypothetical protein